MIIFAIKLNRTTKYHVCEGLCNLIKSTKLQPVSSAMMLLVSYVYLIWAIDMALSLQNESLSGNIHFYMYTQAAKSIALLITPYFIPDTYIINLYRTIGNIRMHLH